MWTGEYFGFTRGTSSSATAASVHVRGISGVTAAAASKRERAIMQILSAYYSCLRPRTLKIQLHARDGPDLVALFLDGVVGIANVDTIRLVHQIEQVDKDPHVFADALARREIHFHPVVKPVIVRRRCPDCCH